MRKPKLLLLDEPLAALDALTRLKMQQQVAALVEQHRLTTLFVTHDVDEALCWQIASCWWKRGGSPELSMLA